jgi:hypothetical protein
MTRCVRETDLEALALLEVPRSSAVEGQRQHVPNRHLDYTMCRSSRHTGIAHQHDAEAAHFARGTRSLRRAFRQSVCGNDRGSGTMVPATRARVPVRAFHAPSRHDLA